MRRALDLQEHRRLEARTRADAGDAHRQVVADMLELHLLLQPIARHVFLHRRDHVERSTSRSLPDRPPCESVNTVSRMISGGSAGLRMMIALPRSAPPSSLDRLRASSR